MIEFIYNQILFYLAIALVLFLPGYFLLLAVFGKSRTISSLERFIFSFGLSLVITNFIAFLYSKFDIPITAASSILGVLIFCATCFIVYKLKKYPSPPPGEMSRCNHRDREGSLFSFSKNQFILILLLLFLTFFIKTAYLSGTVAPTSTDMGHHMYWTKLMTETHKLPDYEGMPDFIIGEHIAIAEISMISGLDLFSAAPVLILFLINLLGILTVFVLSLRVFGNKNIAILTLLFLGVLFAVSSPQAKFVSGGVIGNIMGNFLVPLAFYFYFRAIDSLFPILSPPQGEMSRSDREGSCNSKSYLSLAIFTTFGLFYTHHLTAFIFLFIFALIIPLFLLINFKNIGSILKGSARIIFSPAVISTFILGLVFFFFIFTPNYASKSAVDTAVGSPEKSTRVGLGLTNLKDAVGESRLALGIVGLLMLVLSYQRNNFGWAIFASWAIMLFIMATKPHWLFIDLPSSRIGNYLTYPMAILSAYGLYSIFKPETSNLKILGFLGNIRNAKAPKLLFGAFILILTFVLIDGLSDSAEAFKKSPDFSPMIETFSAARYLAKNTTSEDIILKDHNYIAASDSWIKLLFMRGYRYPLSRAFFRRYEDPLNPREMCTLHMISTPGSPEAKDCFSETKTSFIVINPRYDSAQFRKMANFDAIYNSGEIAIYHKK